MQRKLLMPKLGLTMTEGLIAEWTVKPGQSFRQNDVLFIVETEKVATEIPAESDGVLTEVVVPAGQSVPVGEVVGAWEAGANSGILPVASAGEPVPETRAEVVALETIRPVTQSERAATAGPRVIATPLARRLASQLGVRLAEVQGTGPGKRIKASDVQAAAEAADALQAAQARQPTDSKAQSVENAGATAQSAGLVQPSPVQATMARRLTAGKRDVPHFYLAVDVKVSNLVRLRKELNTIGAGTKFTFNHFVVSAVGRSLQDLPEANRVWEDNGIRCLSSADVGVAVNTDKGLFVPVLRDAGRLSLNEVARGAQSLAERARSGALAAQDMGGGAITVSNAGMHNVRYMTPIINPGQSMILGVGSISRIFRPDDEGRPVLSEEMGLVLACDHRMLDGVSGLTFLNRVVSYLEQPMKLLLSA